MKKLPVSPVSPRFALRAEPAARQWKVYKKLRHHVGIGLISIAI
jgi:hypothetical protein